MTAAAVGAAALAARWAYRAATAYSFRGRVVFVTGGSRGLGLVIARQLVAEGARVAICARDVIELARAEDDLLARGGECLPLVCDVTRSEEVHESVRIVLETWGRIDVLINNAGVIAAGPVQTMTDDDYREALAVHLWGPLHTIDAVLPSMRRRREGRIVNIASIGGKIAVPHLVPYCASKFALVGLSHGLRAELASEGIVVTVVCPGLMRTGSPRNARFKGRHRAEYAWFSISDSLPGVTISAERAARAALDACRHGEAERVLSIPAALAAKAFALAPGLVDLAFALLHPLLPSPGGIGRQSRAGHESTSALAPSVLTTLTDRAAARNNQL